MFSLLQQVLFFQCRRHWGKCFFLIYIFFFLFVFNLLAPQARWDDFPQRDYQDFFLSKLLLILRRRLFVFMFSGGDRGSFSPILENLFFPVVLVFSLLDCCVSGKYFYNLDS